MKLKDAKNISINNVMIDPFNPRFEDKVVLSQERLLKLIIEKKDTREIAASMNQGVKWINKIVIRPLSDELKTDQKIKEEYMEIYKLSEEEFKNRFRYIVVEGNTRLTCLKSGEINGYDRNSRIPVSIAEREKGETLTHYEMEIKRTQGIANVMPVKDWRPLPKAAHVFEMYQLSKILNSKIKLNQVVKDVAEELGMSSSNVRINIKRFAFFNEIRKLSDSIKESRWGYLEAFETNKVSNVFGLSKNSAEFEWNLNDKQLNMLTDTDSKVELQKELLIKIPFIIESAFDDNLNSKQFRDNMKFIIDKYHNDEDKEINDIEDLKDKFSDIISDDETTDWRSISEEMNNSTDKFKWEKDLDRIYKKIDKFPSPADWSDDLLIYLEKIKQKIDYHIQIINLKNNGEDNEG